MKDAVVPPRFIPNALNDLLVMCPVCSEHVKRETLSSHIYLCPRFCTIGCGEKIPPIHQKAHDFFCPAKITTCPAADVGCTYRCQRGVLPQHTSVCSVLSLREVLLQQQRQFQQLQLQIQKLQQQVLEQLQIQQQQQKQIQRLKHKAKIQKTLKREERFEKSGKEAQDKGQPKTATISLFGDIGQGDKVAAAFFAAASEAKAELGTALKMLKEQENQNAKKMEELLKAAEEATGVKAAKAKAELAQYLGQDNVPLRNAKIRAVAAVKKKEKIAADVAVACATNAGIQKLFATFNW